MSSPKILAFAGSTRKNSYNRKLVELAVAGARAAGATVTVVELADYPLPLMDEDLQESSGIPANAKKLKQLFLENDGLLIAAPEYNSSITPLLKNVIDWVSRSEPGESSLAAYANKTAALCSASPSGWGGLRGLVHVRSILGNIGVVVLPDQVCISRAFEAFNPDGSLKEAKQQASIEKLGATLSGVVGKLRG